MRRTNVVAILTTSAALAVLAMPTASTAAGTVPAAPGTRAAPTTSRVEPARPAASTAYQNPTSSEFADTFADPAVMRGKDGRWYAYGTTDPLREGEGTAHLLPISRSKDLVSWEYVGDAMVVKPSWADTARSASLWAPDIRYVNGEYRLYYVVTETTVTDEPNHNAIGMATAPTPTGPWTDSGAPVVGPRRGGSGGAGDFQWTFDPTAVTNSDGTQWLFYGSYYGGVWVVQLSADGRRAVGQPTMVAIDNKFEGAYAVQRGGWWYLFASTANCCAGPTTGYSVQVGRSRSITGPYVDREGTPLTTSRAGGTPTLAQNGNRWIGAGHNAVATDVRGQDWIVYHALNRADPYLDGTDGINERPMLMDRLDWVDGWPAVRGGAGPSEGMQRGPTTGLAAPEPSPGDWTQEADPQAGTAWQSTAEGTLLAEGASATGVRVEADLRSSGSPYGLTSVARDGSAVRLAVDPGSRVARLEHVRDGRVVAARWGTVPAVVDPSRWQAAALQVGGRLAVAELSPARLGDPVLRLSLTTGGVVPAPRAGVVAAGEGVGAANLSVTTPAGAARLVKDQVPDELDPSASDEFDSAALSGWMWRRPDPAAGVVDGALHWPVQAADLVGSGNNASVLLRDPGEGAWTAETKVSIDLGVDSVRNFQQAGLVVWANDDDFARLSHVAIWNTRQVEYGREQPHAGRLPYGGTIAGPPAETTWLRVTRDIDLDTDQQAFRAWSSRDGSTWVKAGVWTMPADADVRVGLISHGKNDASAPSATARFDYLRIYR